MSVCLSRYVYAGNTAKAVLKTVALKEGSAELLVRFSSKQLTDVLGAEDVKVVA